MSELLTNLSVIQSLSQDLVKSRNFNYLEQSVENIVDTSKFHIQNIPNIKNISGCKIKCSFISHKRHPEADPDKRLNTRCIVFLHGLGSNRIESLYITKFIPPQYCLFVFDFEGFGKSYGENITYGIRQSEDINFILQYLAKQKQVHQFVIWGRSMGAVAALLFAINLSNGTKQLDSAQNLHKKIKGLVLDSPFSDFQQITKQIGLKKFKIPQFLIDFALNSIKENFNTILKDRKRWNKIYNPFSIKLGSQKIQTKIPTIFVYSQNDEVVPKYHSQKIIKSYKSTFQKIVLHNCKHNESRPRQAIQKIFDYLNSFRLQHQRKKSEGIQVVQINNYMLSKRGIKVESKQKQKQKFNNDYKSDQTPSRIAVEHERIKSQIDMACKAKLQQHKNKKISCRTEAKNVQDKNEGSALQKKSVCLRLNLNSKLISQQLQKNEKISMSKLSKLVMANIQKNNNQAYNNLNPIEPHINPNPNPVTNPKCKNIQNQKSGLSTAISTPPMSISSSSLKSIHKINSFPIQKSKKFIRVNSSSGSIKLIFQ